MKVSNCKSFATHSQCHIIQTHHHRMHPCSPIHTPHYKPLSLTFSHHTHTHTHSSLQNWDFAEIQVVAKHKSVFGKDRVIGIAVVPFSSVTQDANLTLGLSASIPLSMHCQAILNVLSVRTYDEAAKDFVALKRQQRETGSYGDE